MTILRLLPLLLLLSVATTSVQEASSLERFSSRNKKRRVRGRRQAKPERRRLKHFPNQGVSQQIFDRLRNLNNSEDVYKELYEPDRPSEEGKRPSEEGKRSGKSGKSEKRSRKGAPKSKLTKSSAQSAKRSSRKGGMDSGEGGGGDGDGGGSGGDGDRDSDDGRFEPDGFDFTDCDSFSNAWLYELLISCVEDGDNLINCDCPTSENLLTVGRLTCATQEERFMNPPACPFRCPVCEFCMVLNGCEDIYDDPLRP